MVSTALSRRLKLAAPVLAVGVVAAGVTLPRLADAADASAALPPRTAAQLLEAVAQADVEGLSGTVVSTSRLGLPELPSGGHGGGAVSLTDLLSGSTTARVWKAGDDRSRVSLLEQFAEFVAVRDGRDLWTYDSASSEVDHLVLPEHTGEEPAPAPSGTATPQDLAERLLSFVEPTTTVTVGRAEEVAGRAAYELVLEPKDDPRTLVEEVRIAVDGETSVPLRVQAYGGGPQTEPAVEVAFTSVQFEVPDESVFDFTPPTGSTVTERSLQDLAANKTPDARAAAPTALPQVLGSGWSTVVETSGVQLPEQAQAMFGQLSTPARGGRAITSALLTVLLTDDGRLLVGAVPTDELETLAAR